MQERIGQQAQRPTPKHDPRTAPLPPAGQAALARLEHALRPAPARWPGEIARHGTVTITHTPHTPWPYGTACHTCHHTDIHRTHNDATTTAHTHNESCHTAPLPAVTA